MELPKCPHCDHDLVAKDVAANRCWFCEKKLSDPVEPKAKEPAYAAHLGIFQLFAHLGQIKEPREALRFLWMTVLGLCGVAAFYVLMVYLKRPSHAMITAVVLLGVAGLVASLVGILGLFITTVRFRMHKSLAVLVVVLTGSIGGIYYWKEMEAAEHERREQIRSVHNARETIESYVNIPNLKPLAQPSPHIRGKVVLIADGDVDYAGHAPPLGLWSREPPRLEMQAAHARLSDLFFELPRDLQAESPSEVETIVWIHSLRTVIGQYPKKKEDKSRISIVLDLPDYAYHYRTTVTIIDRVANEVVDVNALSTTDPLPEPAPDGEDAYKELNRAIVAYIKSQPRK